MALPPPAEPSLSPAQRGLWVLDQLAPGNAFYNVPVAYRLRGDLDTAALSDALRLVAERHEVLRTSIVADHGAPAALLRPPGAFAPETADLSALPEGRRDAEAYRRVVVEAGRPFDLAAELPFRSLLLRLSKTDHVLVAVFHHVAADETSAAIVLREVAAAYGDIAAGRRPGLPPVRVQYAEVARRQRESLRGEDLDVLLAYWRKQLHDAPREIALPFDRPAPPVPSYKGATVAVELPEDVTAATAALAGAENVAPDVVLLAGFAAVLHRYTSQDDLVLGWLVDGRGDGMRDVVGTFVNVLPLRVGFAGDQTFAALVADVRDALSELTEHRELPLEKLIEELRPRRTSGHAPLFQVAVAASTPPADELVLAGLEAERVPLEESTARFDLFLGITRGPRGVRGALELATDVFDPATIHALGRHWVNLLRAAVVAPQERVSALAMLDERERAELLSGGAAGEGPEHAPLVHEAVALQAATRPDAPAVVAGDVTLSYAELDREARMVAGALAAVEVPRGAVVALTAERGPRMVPAMLGVLKAGCAYLPLDPAYPSARLALMLEDSGASALVGEVPAGLTVPDGVAVVPPDGGTAPAALEDVDPRDLAYVIYTSGSTGRPKGVMVEHDSLARFAAVIAAELGLTAGDRMLQFASPSFDTAVEEIWPTLACGGTLVVRGPHPWDPAELRAAVDARGITVLDLPTAYWHELVSACADGIDVRECPSLRVVVVGGEAMSADKTRLWLSSAPREVRLLNTYGPTETTVTATSFALSGAPPGHGTVPIGAPIAGARAYVLDDALEPVPAGVTGELFVGGTGVARGYLGRPRLTADRFLPDPFAGRPGARMYRTGDRVRLRRDGILDFAGRRDHQLKVHGYRVEPGEIEAALRTHPGVRDAVVTAAPGDTASLAGYFVVSAGAPDAEALRDWLRDRLPGHMVPAVLVPLESLPQTPGGKVDRKALEELVPDAGRRRVEAPRTPAEQVLQAIWQGLLGTDDVGVEDSFFDLGGHSLLATRLVSRIRHDFGVSLPLRTVFEWPTISGLAAVVEHSAAGAATPEELPLERVPRDRDLPLSFAQQRLWFIDQFKPGSADYVIAARAELRGPLDVDALRGALAALAARHEALRTTFPSSGGEPRQEVAAAAHVAFELVDVGHLPAAERDAVAAAIVQREAATPFDLATGPLWRSTLIRMADDHHLFVTCMHHIVSDGWSLGIFAADLSELYSAAVERREQKLPELDVSYADFAVWQRRWFTGDELERQLAYWKTQLHGAPAVLELPADRPRPPVQSFDGATVGFTLDDDLAAAIARLARAHEVTTFMVTLAAFKTLLHRYTGATDVVVGSPIAGRNRSEIEGLIGFFVNTLVLRTDLSGDPTFAELLERTREVALGAYAHQDLPFEKLVEELGIERDLAHSPAVQVMFVLQNTPPADLALKGVEPARLDAPTNEVSVDLTMDLTETETAIEAKLVYNAGLFDGATMERLLRHYVNVLREVADDPQVPLSRIELLDPSERRAIVHGFNPPPTPYPSHLRVHEAFERVAAERTEAAAVVYDEGELTYGELNRKANRLARHLVANGVERGDLVAVALDRGPDLVVSLLAVLKAGAAYLPIDPEHPRRRTRFMIEDAEARVLVTSDQLAAVLDLGAARTISLQRDAAAIEAHGGGDPGIAGTSEDAAYAIYTSGSTGTPKGICIPHRAITRLVLETDYVKLGPGSVVFQVSNASFDAATFEIWGPLLNGGLVAGIPKDVLLDAARLRPVLRRWPGAVVFLTTALFNQLVADDPALFAGLDAVLTGGEAVDPASLRRCLETAPPKDLVHVYGPTETTTFATWHRVEEVPEGAATVPIGRPIANTVVHILDAALNPVPVGVPGEIYIGGPGLATGYLNRPELTKERFVPDPLSGNSSALLYKTGDLARYLPSGDVEFLGRIDSQVKIRGFRVELGEIEATLAEHDAVSEAVVDVFETAPNDKRLVAYLTASGGGVPVPELRRFLSERIPFYMVPGEFVVLDALPLNANGKIDRRALPAPDLARHADAREHVAPRGETERKLASIWEELLGRAPGVHDNFFELGGHSLMATQLVSRVRDAFSVELELRAVFEAPTIARLAPRVDAAVPAPADVPQLRPLPRR
ncbi:MAG: amino acid adenylation domain-containing protein [Actinomycetota bacterium]|nr:amino acid adenylation domain-containing protein [Actinomycetota bacterium]